MSMPAENRVLSAGCGADDERSHRIRIKNRRKVYLDKHPEYFCPDLELADPLLYDRLIRRFQTASDREAEGRSKGFSGVLEADILRSEAKIEALKHPDVNAPLSYRRGPNGEILAEEEGEVPLNKEEGETRWRKQMELRFMRGDDEGFDYQQVDESEDYDDHVQEERDRQDHYFSAEEPRWVLGGIENGQDESRKQLVGETGIQDF